jgi:hypothetical protein
MAGDVGRTRCGQVSCMLRFAFAVPVLIYTATADSGTASRAIYDALRM